GSATDEEEGRRLRPCDQQPLPEIIGRVRELAREDPPGSGESVPAHPRGERQRGREAGAPATVGRRVYPRSGGGPDPERVPEAARQGASDPVSRWRRDGAPVGRTVESDSGIVPSECGPACCGCRGRVLQTPPSG